MALVLGPHILGARIVVDGRGAGQEMDSAKGKTTSLKGAFDSTASAAQGLTGQLVSLAGALGVGGLSFGLGEAIQSAAKFETSMAKVQTLLNEGQNATKLYGKSVEDLASRTGLAAAEVSEGLFQAISSGIVPSRVTGFMDTMSKAAIGGFTDIKTAVDGTTTVMNVYGLVAGEASKVTDAMFVANKLGKTTFEELASMIGNLAPTTAAMGVSFQEMMATIGATTKAGIDTSTSIASVRQALSALAKPSSEAEKLAEKLGLRFDEGAIKAVGFTKWLEQLGAATGGSLGQMTALFGSVEAANTMLVLTKEQGIADVTQGLAEMTSGASLTAKAFNDVNGTFERKVAKLGESFSKMTRRVGVALIKEIAGPTEKVAAQLEGLADNAEAAASRIIKSVKEMGRVLEAILVVWSLGKIGTLSRGLFGFLSKPVGAGAGGMGQTMAGATMTIHGATLHIYGAVAGTPGAVGVAGGGAAGAGGKLSAAQKFSNAIIYLQGAAVAIYAGMELGKALAYHLDASGERAEGSVVRKRNNIESLARILRPDRVEKYYDQGYGDKVAGKHVDHGGGDRYGAQRIAFAIRAAMASDAKLGPLGGTSPNMRSMLEIPTLKGSEAAQQEQLAKWNARTGRNIGSSRELDAFADALIAKLRLAVEASPVTKANAVMQSGTEGWAGRLVRGSMTKINAESGKDFAYDAGGELLRLGAAMEAWETSVGENTARTIEAQDAEAQSRAEGMQVLTRELGNYADKLTGGLKDFLGDLFWKIEIDHKITDSKKPARKHSAGVRLSKRGAGEAKHLSPTYRLYAMQTGAGAGIIRPLPENYVNAAVLNSGVDR